MGTARRLTLVVLWSFVAAGCALAVDQDGDAVGADVEALGAPTSQPVTRLEDRHRGRAMTACKINKELQCLLVSAN